MEEENIHTETLDEILETYLIDVSLKKDKKHCIARFLRLWDKEDIIILIIAKLVTGLGRIGQVQVLNR